MYLFGASGHAKVIIDILESQKLSVDGIFDDNLDIRKLLHFKVSGNLNVKSPLIVSVGNNQIRKTIVERFKDIDFGQAIHASSQISRYSNIGDGTVVMHGAIIQSGVEIGKHCIINTGASVDHDCVIEDYVHISPHSTLCGNVKIGEGTWVGAGTVIIPGVKIGRWCIIGAGSVVTKDLPDNVLAVGNRCRVIKKINL